MSSDGLYLVYSEEEVSKMVYELRKQGMPLNKISQKITDEACTNYYCKDNVTMMIIDLKKHYHDFHR